MSKVTRRLGLLLSCFAILGLVSVLSPGGETLSWCWPGTNCTGTG